MASRFDADPGTRGGSPFESTGAPSSQRGGFNSEQNPSASAGQEVLSSQLPGNPHSSRGFRRALRATQGRSNRLIGQLPSKSEFSGPKFRKPNYFAQGGGRHGMHIGAGAPFTGAAGGDSAEGFGGE